MAPRQEGMRPHAGGRAGATARRSIDIATRRLARVAPQNYYRLATTAEIEPLEGNKSTYHGVMLSANFVSFYSSTVASRLSVLQKPFFVDPDTAPLGQDLDLIGRDGAMRSSYRRLVERMDEATGSDALGERVKAGRLTPADFGVGRSGGAADLTDAFAAGALDLQKKCLDPAASKRNDSAKKYMGILGEGAGSGPAGGPEFAVAPYFCAPDAASDWFEVNAKLFKAAARFEKGVYAVLCMDGDPSDWVEMARKAAKGYAGAGGFLVWVNGFNDTRAPESHLEGYRDALSAVKGAKKPVIALYAGHYALLLSEHTGIDGYVRGIGSGEMRDLGAQVGGGFPPRYYLRGVHVHAMQESAAAALEAARKIRCSCKACRDAMKKAGTRRGGRGERYKRMIQAMGRGPLCEHFMRAHKSEIDYVGRGGRAARDCVMENLGAADVGRIANAGVRTRHLDRWRAALS